MRFQRTVLHLLRAESVIENFVGFGKASINVAFGENSLVRDIGAENRMLVARQHAIHPIGTKLVVH